ncbi:tyrosine-protein phosphatase [Pedobacter sp. SYSU D00535]|uniref:tyrosine-protein phosphatase n=1 Tax=Pedobacter sp. SYSU D00535 TaxID=2810308 RepID=UPI001A979754|nr:CpsB/CapC family capsule biosynthesis tyrosine phosphatase [Pedobacter sp. SYSU D00535]
MHSHLIPGVDDGSGSVTESEHMINGLFDLGFTHLFTTPHTISELHPNTLTTISQGFKELEGLQPAIKLDWSSEYFLDELFLSLLENNQVKPLPGNRLLIEFSMVTKPLNLESQLSAISQKGYQIVLAHPERYLFLQKKDLYQKLRDQGIEFQVNALSLVGNYGKRIKKAADELIREEMIDFIGTDLHHPKALKILRKVPSTSSFKTLVKSGCLKNQTLL